MKRTRKKTIFQSLLIPLLIVIILESLMFYMVSLYGGMERTLKQNAVTVLSERLLTSKNELVSNIRSRSFNLGPYVEALDQVYNGMEGSSYGPLNSERQIEYLGRVSDILVRALRGTWANGVFLILDDRSRLDDASLRKYGVCIRDMDQQNTYVDREDLLVVRSPSAIVDRLGCPLDSSWEAMYTFSSEKDGSYFYEPIKAARANPTAESVDMGYLEDFYPEEPVFRFSVPLVSENGYPYGVLGVEFSMEFLSSQLSHNQIEGLDNLCYVMVMKEDGSDLCIPGAASKVLYDKYLQQGQPISVADRSPYGGFTIRSKDGEELFGQLSEMEVLSNNNPFGNRRLMLMVLLESRTLFSTVEEIKVSLLLISGFCLVLGVIAVVLVSRSFSYPITRLTRKVRTLKPQDGFNLDRLGISEIDQLIDSIEELNRDTSRNIARTEFFSRMSHDMRTPMNAIISFSSPFMLKDASQQTRNEYFEKIHSSGNYLLGLINEVLDMTKIESNKVEFVYTTIAEKQICASVVPIIEELARAKGVRLTVCIKSTPDALVVVDVQHLDQIVMNLLSNAIKFTPKGGDASLDVSFNPIQSDDSRRLCRIIVSDSGIGIDDEFMAKLFVPFEQEHSGQEGSGLGLSISKKLVDLMGGTINCSSRKGKGSVFTVMLPVNVGAPDRLESSEKVQDISSLKGKRILICEDNSINATIVSHLLEKLGIKSTIAEDGQAGVQEFSRAKPHAYDAILMDIRMPRMDGLQATRCIRAMERPDAREIPIIAMTADAFKDDAALCREAGMNQHLSKPIQMELFISTLLKYLS